MTHEIVAVEGDTGVSRVEVFYDGPPPRHYRDLWIVRLDESGRCTHFEEWPFWPEQGTARCRILPKSRVTPGSIATLAPDRPDIRSAK